MHGGDARLQVGFRDDRADLFLELLDVRLQAAEFGDAIEHEADLRRREGLRQEIGRPSPHGLHRRLDRGIRRDDDYGQAGAEREKRTQNVEPLFLPQPQIEEHDVERRAAHELVGLCAVAGLGDAVAHRLQGKPQRFAQARLVVNQEDIHVEPAPFSPVRGGSPLAPGASRGGDASPAMILKPPIGGDSLIYWESTRANEGVAPFGGLAKMRRPRHPRLAPGARRLPLLRS